MPTNHDAATLVRAIFDAYLHKDRPAIEKLLSDDFVFTSPYDDHLDRKTYFERCWPGSEHMRMWKELKLFTQGDEAFLLYEAQFGSAEVFRNTEFFRTKDGKITEVQVYFGSPTKDSKTK